MGCGINLSYRIGPCPTCSSYYRVHVESSNAQLNKHQAMLLAKEYCSDMGKDYLVVSQTEVSSFPSEVIYQMDFDCVAKVLH